jgi:hypothetical protein
LFLFVPELARVARCKATSVFAAAFVFLADILFPIRDHPIAPRSPWQNVYVERLIGSIRRECLDHMIVFGEAQPAPDPTRICRLL